MMGNRDAQNPVIRVHHRLLLTKLMFQAGSDEENCQHGVDRRYDSTKRELPGLLPFRPISVSGIVRSNTRW
jgi:hypothetical protein